VYCAKCKAENADGLKYCNQCGTPFKTSCASCGFENAPAAKFCGQCGASLERAAAVSSRKSADAPIQIAGTPVPEPVDGERKTVTALFADIKGSMDLIEDLDPEEARAIVDPALKLMMEAVHHYAEIYSWFIEGFDSADLKDAKAYARRVELMNGQVKSAG
jgi:double zinc ribbon protein